VNAKITGEAAGKCTPGDRRSFELSGSRWQASWLTAYWGIS
jgi:hypothetical protein